jgi:hypothetical protein
MAASYTTDKAADRFLNQLKKFTSTNIKVSKITGIHEIDIPWGEASRFISGDGQFQRHDIKAWIKANPGTIIELPNWQARLSRWLDEDLEIAMQPIPNQSGYRLYLILPEGYEYSENFPR